MPYDKVVDSKKLDDGLTLIANSIRNKTIIQNELVFPEGFSKAIKSINEGEHPIYNGQYSVTPKANETVLLQTKNKILKDNVTVEKVPYFETSNDYGETIYIASEVKENANK